eukprot:1159612-Pelagomonas_calceolata.AAC.3
MSGTRVWVAWARLVQNVRLQANGEGKKGWLCTACTCLHEQLRCMLSGSSAPSADLHTLYTSSAAGSEG